MKTLIWLFLFISSSSFAQTNEQFIQWIKRKCDRQLELRLGEENFKKYVVQNNNQSNLECIDGRNYTLSSDSIDCKISSVRIVYDIILDDITLYSISFLSDSIGEIDCPGNSDWRYDLEGYKELINGKFPIDYERACRIVKEMNYDPSEYKLELVYVFGDKEGLRAYEWRGNMYLEKTIKKVIYVDAFSGEFHEVLIQYVSEE